MQRIHEMQRIHMLFSLSKCVPVVVDMGMNTGIGMHMDVVVVAVVVDVDVDARVLLLHVQGMTIACFGPCFHPTRYPSLLPRLHHCHSCCETGEDWEYMWAE